MSHKIKYRDNLSYVHKQQNHIYHINRETSHFAITRNLRTCFHVCHPERDIKQHKIELPNVFSEKVLIQK